MDNYLEDPSRLNGTPKLTIGNYVESEGGLVAPRFDSVYECLSSGYVPLLRSEHEQEYAGISGLLESLNWLDEVYFKSLTDLVELKNAYFNYVENVWNFGPNFWSYCELLGLNREQFKSDCSFSVWGLLGGSNSTVIADSSIDGRYHVLSSFPNGKFNDYSYLVVKDNVAIREMGASLPNKWASGVPKLLESYEFVRNLDRFDPGQCPIMEFQSFNKEHYFLQYHRGRDFVPASFVLERPARSDEFEAFFVRGATPSSEGIDVSVTLAYPSISNEELLSFPDDDSYDILTNNLYSELRLRDRKAQFFSMEYYNEGFRKLVDGHLAKSKMFKPEISVVHYLYDLLEKQKFSKLVDRAYHNKEFAKINYNLISDGRRALVKRR